MYWWARWHPRAVYILLATAVYILPRALLYQWFKIISNSRHPWRTDSWHSSLVVLCCMVLALYVEIRLFHNLVDTVVYIFKSTNTLHCGCLLKGFYQSANAFKHLVSRTTQFRKHIWYSANSAYNEKLMKTIVTCTPSRFWFIGQPIAFSRRLNYLSALVIDPNSFLLCKSVWWLQKTPECRVPSIFIYCPFVSVSRPTTDAYTVLFSLLKDIFTFFWNFLPHIWHFFVEVKSLISILSQFQRSWSYFTWWFFNKFTLLRQSFLLVCLFSDDDNH